MTAEISPEQELADAERALQRVYVTKAGYDALREATRRYRAAVRRFVEAIHERTAPP